MNNIQDLVAKTTKTLILDEPFYGLFLIGINKQFSNKYLQQVLVNMELACS
jgi:hypothetical protein